MGIQNKFRLSFVIKRAQPIVHLPHIFCVEFQQSTFLCINVQNALLPCFLSCSLCRKKNFTDTEFLFVLCSEPVLCFSVCRVVAAESHMSYKKVLQKHPFL